jgi:hypothetical protein
MKRGIAICLAIELASVFFFGACSNPSGSEDAVDSGEDAVDSGEDATITVLSPSITVSGSGVARTVTISSSESGAAVYYTIDGSEPTASSSPYSAAITVAGFGVTKTVKAVAVLSGTSSAVVAQNVTVSATAINLDSTCAVKILAGTGSTGSSDGNSATATFGDPMGICSDGTYLYVTDSGNCTIRKIDATGTVSTLAGQAGYMGYDDGVSSAAEFNNPLGICTDGASLYVADTYNNMIRKIVIASGAVTTLAGSSDGSSGSADGTGRAASFDSPSGICTDGVSLFVSDFDNHKIRKIDIATAVVTTLAGSGSGPHSDGTGTGASICYPYGIVTDGSNLFVCEWGNNGITKINIASAAVTSLKTDLGGLYGIATDGTNLYLAMAGVSQIKRVVIATLSDSVDSILVAGDGTGYVDNTTGSSAKFYYPYGIAYDGSSTLYVTDRENQRIRKIQ